MDFFTEELEVCTFLLFLGPAFSNDGVISYDPPFPSNVTSDPHTNQFQPSFVVVFDLSIPIMTIALALLLRGWQDEFGEEWVGCNQSSMSRWIRYICISKLRRIVTWTCHPFARVGSTDFNICSVVCLLLGPTVLLGRFKVLFARWLRALGVIVRVHGTISGDVSLLIAFVALGLLALRG